MEKNIKDYLHLYLGCDVVCKSEFPAFDRTARLDGVILDLPNDLHPVKVSCYYPRFKNRFHYQYKFDAVKPILRPLSDMTEEEDLAFRVENRGEWIDMHWHPEGFAWLLSKGFDLFGLIPAGLAIDKTTLKQ